MAKKGASRVPCAGFQHALEFGASHLPSTPNSRDARPCHVHMAAHTPAPAKGGWPKSCKICDAPFTSVIDDDIGDSDETASVCIIGGGPHALAALAALHEGSLSFEQFGSDSMFQARMGFGSLEKIGNGVCLPAFRPLTPVDFAAH